MHFDNDTDLYRVIGANIKYYREQTGVDLKTAKEYIDRLL